MKKIFAIHQKMLSLLLFRKTFPKEHIEKIIRLGQRIFGENKVQEAAIKWPQLKNNLKTLNYI